MIAFLNTSGGKIYVDINNDKSVYKIFNENERDKIDLQISDFGLDVLKTIKEFLGIKVSEIVIKLQKGNLIVNSDKVRNEIKRNLYKYIVYKGSNKNGGYYLK